MKLLKFYADWCQPCKSLTPILTNLLADKTDIQLEEVDIDNNRDLLTKYNVRSVPTLVIVDEEGNKLRDFKGFDITPAYKERLVEFLG